MNRIRLTSLALAAAIPILAFAADEPARMQSHADHGQDSPWKSSSPLVEKVRKATERYRDIRVALREKWVQATPCVSGPNEGAMGVHFTFPGRIGDGILDPEQPELLIYEPLGGNRWRLVGVEFVELAEVWDTQNTTPAILDGHLMNLVPAPNRYGLPAFYELHVWGWEPNPKGNFADWNTRVTCDKQAAATD
jgi:hypothetical protein